MKIRILAAVLALVAAISGCSSSGNAILQTLPHAYGRNPGVDNARLNPNFQYLRVTISGRVALLALGDVDNLPRGPVEVWYSAEREVLRLQNGRLVGAVGLTTEWRNVILPELPSWATAARSDQAYRWTRSRDVMPGYRFGVTDQLELHAVGVPAKSELRGLDPQKLRWFEERVDAARGGRFAKVFGADTSLPPSRYAVDIQGDRETVVYAEQCLAAELCFSWQRWPASAQKSAGRK